MSGRVDPADPIFPAQTCPECGGGWPHTVSEPCAALTLPFVAVGTGKRKGTSGMSPAPPVVPIRAVKPASLCPVCGMAPVDVVRSRHELVQQADYLCPGGHIWQTRWTVA